MPESTLMLCDYTFLKDYWHWMKYSFPLVVWSEIHTVWHCLRPFVLTTHSFFPSDLETSDKIKRQTELLDPSLCLWRFDSLFGLTLKCPELMDCSNECHHQSVGLWCSLQILIRLSKDTGPCVRMLVFLLYSHNMNPATSPLYRLKKCWLPSP